MSKKLIKTLLILEKVEQERAKALQQDQITHQQELTRIDHTALELDAQLAYERAVLWDVGVDMGVTTLSVFEDTLQEQKQTLLDKKILHEEELSHVHEHLHDTYATLKTWENLRKKREMEEASSRLKDEQDTLDEVAHQRSLKRL